MNFSIAGFLNSILPVFFTSGLPETATTSPSLNLDSIYCGPNHFAFKLPDSSDMVSVAILNLVFVVKTDNLSIVPKIVTS